MSSVFNTYKSQYKELNDINDYLTDLTLKDPLTKLWNHKFMDDWFSKKENYENKNLSVILFDIDNFKKINDTFGHQVGDYVLTHVTSIIRNSISDNSFPIRYGGEEFLVLLPGISNSRTVKFGNYIRKTIQSEVKIPNEKYVITISGGVSTLAEGKTIKELVKEADDNLYIEKKQGRNKIVN